MFGIPVVALRDTVVFPGMVIPLRIGRTASVRAVETAYADRGQVLLVAERDGDDLFEVGTVGTIAQLVRFPDGTYQALIQGISRARVTETKREGEMLRAEF